MSYEWITPKTDWTTTSRFEYTDYNRIRNNLLYLNDMLNEKYPEKAQPLDLGDAKTGYANEYSVSEFIAFEDALESFTRVGRDANIGDRNYYRGNDSFIWADALNRLEQCCLRWKEPVSEDCIEHQLPYSIKNGGSSVSVSMALSPVEAKSDWLIIGGGEGTFEGSNQMYAYNGNSWIKRQNLPYPMFGGALFTITGGDLYVLGGMSNGSPTSKFYKYVGLSDWSSKPNYPVGITGIDGCAVVLDDNLFIFGGSTGITSSDYDNTYKIDIQLNSWSNKLDKGIKDGSVITYDNYFFSITDDYNGLTKTSWHNNQLWSSFYTALPHKNYGGKLVNYHNQVYYFGGSETDKSYYKLVGNEFVKVGTLEYPFQYGTVSIYKDKIYCIGGIGSSADKMYEILTY